MVHLCAASELHLHPLMADLPTSLTTSWICWCVFACMCVDMRLEAMEECLIYQIRVLHAHLYI